MNFHVLIESEELDGKLLVKLHLYKDLPDDPRVTAEEVQAFVGDIDMIEEFMEDWFRDELWYKECDPDQFYELVQLYFENPAVEINVYGTKKEKLISYALTTDQNWNKLQNNNFEYALQEAMVQYSLPFPGQTMYLIEVETVIDDAGTEIDEYHTPVAVKVFDPENKTWEPWRVYNSDEELE